MKTTPKIKTKNDDGLKKRYDLNYEDDLKNEDDLKHGEAKKLR